MAPPPQVAQAIELATSATPIATWKLQCNFGREESSRPPSASYGAGGGRLPLRIEVDFTTAPGDEEGELLITPRAPLVRFTDFVDPWRTVTGTSDGSQTKTYQMHIAQSAPPPLRKRESPPGAKGRVETRGQPTLFLG